MRLNLAVPVVCALLAIPAIVPRAASAEIQLASAEIHRVHGGDTIGVGDVLQALEDVELDQAVVARGSRVSVSRRSESGGTVFFDVALADGHVVRAVPITRIARSFRRVADE